MQLMQPMQPGGLQATWAQCRTGGPELSASDSGEFR